MVQAEVRKPGSEEPKPDQTKGTGRKAGCLFCNNTEPSNPDLAFFKARPDRQEDEFYCGCCGWD